MNHTRLLSCILTTPLLLASCSVQSDEYDTPPPYSEPAAPSNPIYDTPAAYGDDMPGNPAQSDPGLPADPAAPAYAETTPPAASTTAPATPAAPHVAAPSARTEPIVHTVIKGDTLSGLSAKYKVPAASIRSANNMTGDTVVLGRRMIIPAR